MTTYEAKIVRDGDHLVLTFPVEVLDALGAKPGDEIIWELSSDGTVTIRPTFGDKEITASIGDALDKLL